MIGFVHRMVAGVDSFLEEGTQSEPDLDQSVGRIDGIDPLRTEEKESQEQKS